METVGPAVVVMPDDAGTDPGPFVKILGRIDVVRLDPLIVLNGGAQPVERFDPLLLQVGDEPVGKGEIVAGGIVRIPVRVPEDVVDVHKYAPAEFAAGIVQPGIGDACLAQVMEQGTVPRSEERRTAHAVQGLDLFLEFAA